MQNRNFTEEEILELVKDENFRRKFFSALKQLMQKDREKQITEIVSYQSSVYTVSRDVEEIHILPEAVEKILPTKLYSVDTTGEIKISEEGKEVLAKYLFKYGKSLEDYLSPNKTYPDALLKVLLKGLQELNIPFDVDKGWQWVVKMLKNLTVKTPEFVDGEYYPIDVSLPEPIYRQDKKVGDMYQVGIKKKQKIDQKTKTVFEPFFSVSIITDEEGKRRIFINGIDILEMPLNSLNKLMQRISKEKEEKENQLLKLKAEYSRKKTKSILGQMKQISADLIRLSVEEKLWDKSIFFLKTVSSSRLNQILKTVLKDWGLIPMRKNRDILVEDFISTKELQRRLVLIRVLGDVLKDIAEENSRLVKQLAKNIPSLSKLKKRYFLIEEIALLGEKEIRIELVDKYREAIKKLEDFIAHKTDIDLEKDETIKIALALSNKMKLPADLKEEFNKLYKKALEMQKELTINKLLSWDNESFSQKINKLEKALDIIEPYKEEIFSSFSPTIIKALQELTEEAQSPKEIKKLGDILLQKYSLLKQIEDLNQSIWFKKAIFKIRDVNLNKAKTLQKLYNVNFQLFERKKRKVKL